MDIVEATSKILSYIENLPEDQEKQDLKFAFCAVIAGIEDIEDIVDVIEKSKRGKLWKA